MGRRNVIVKKLTKAAEGVKLEFDDYTSGG